VFLGTNSLFSKVYSKHKENFSEKKDERVNLIVELFENIKFIKQSALENQYIAKAIKKKEEELKYIKKLLLRYVVSSVLNELGPAVFLIAINAFDLWFTSHISLEKAFTSTIIMSIIKKNFKDLPDMLIAAVDIVVSSKRISYYLFSEEVDTAFITYTSPAHSDQLNYGVVLKNGNFYWKDDELKKLYEEEKAGAFKKDKSKKNKKLKGQNKEKNKRGNENVYTDLEGEIELFENFMQLEEPPGPERLQMIIKNANFSLPRGTCTAIIGKVGCGKSSLLSAMLGEMYSMPGTNLKIDRKIAYVSQQAWTVSKSIRDNIVMGLPFDESRFRDALRYSCFLEDLDDMPNRELTVIGNKGINLSGGQKARLSIARALYSDADVYLFDDPISALDINVGKAVMEKAILEYLRGKTVLVATHALVFLPYFDKILLLVDGEIKFDGSYEELQSDACFSETQSLLSSDHQKLISEAENEQTTHSAKQPDDSHLPKPKSLQPKPSRQPPSQPKLFRTSSLGLQQQSSQVEMMRLMEEKIVSDVLNIEDKARGRISWNILRAYLSMVGWFRFAITFICTLVSLSAVFVGVSELPLELVPAVLDQRLP
jgi:ABC-type multidrug transport system fused ATPase/permease subunit